jgi:hypothetical protein
MVTLTGPLASPRVSIIPAHICRAISGQPLELDPVPEQCRERCTGKLRSAPLFLINRPDTNTPFFSLLGELPERCRAPKCGPNLPSPHSAAFGYMVVWIMSQRILIHIHGMSRTVGR